MPLNQIAELISSTGLPVTYLCWPENKAPAMPYICWHSPGTANFSADNAVYYSVNQVRVELYTEIKSPETEKLVEEALRSVFWSKTETYIDTERCYQIDYDFEV